jgi:urease accessory protein
MPDRDQALLRLIWLASPALPVGGFSYSDGLEPAIDAGFVHDESSARVWLTDQLELALARSELPLLAHAMLAWAQHDAPRAAALNQWLITTRETAEQRQQTLQMGRSMQQWLLNTAEGGDARVGQLIRLAPAPGWPIAFALAAVLADARPRDALLAFAFAWAENLVQAALKAVPLGQSAGQRVLAQLAKCIPAAVDRASALDDSQRQAFAPMLAILSSQHETQYSRLFRS